MARTAGPWRPLAHRLAHSVVAVPPAQRRVADRGLVLISPPNERTIAQKRGQCLASAPPATVESGP
jgi:hypothetical protein